MWFQDVQSGFPSCVRGVKVTSCLVLSEAAKRGGLGHRFAALRVGDFEVARSGGSWVAIGAVSKLISLCGLMGLVSKYFLKVRP